MANVQITCLEDQVKFAIGDGDCCSGFDVRTIPKTDLEVKIVDGVITFFDPETDEPIEGLAFTTLEITNLDFPTTGDYFDFLNLCLLGNAVAPATTIQEHFFHVSSAVSVGNYDVNVLAAAGTQNYTFEIPSDFESLASLELVVFSTGTEAGPVDVDLSSSYGSEGEAKDTHTQSNTLTPLAFVANQLRELDLSSVFTSLAPGDNCGVDITNNLAGNLNVLGVKIRFNSSNGLGGVTTFLALGDTPSAYGGQMGKVVAVNSTEDKLEFITLTNLMGLGVDQRIARWDGTDTLESSAWEVLDTTTGALRPTTAGTDIGGTAAANRIGTIFMASTIDFAAGSDLSFAENGVGTHLFIENTTGNVGFGETSPGARVHITDGSSGGSALAGTSLIVENSVAARFSLLSPSATAKTIFFGDELGTVQGGISFNPSGSDGMDFRTGGNTPRVLINGLGQFFVEANTLFGDLTTTPASQVHIFDGSSGQTPTPETDLLIESSGIARIEMLTPSGSAASIFYGNEVGNIRAGIAFNGGGNDEIIFKSNGNVDRIYIGATATGVVNILNNVFIGDLVTAPTARIHAEGAGLSSATYAAKFDNNNSDPILHIVDNRRLGIGITDPGASVQIDLDNTLDAWGDNGSSLRLVASTSTDDSTAASGTAATAAINSFGIPTIDSTNGGVGTEVTITDAATMFIAGVPIPVTDKTLITNAYSLWAKGNVRFDDGLTVGGNSVTTTDPITTLADGATVTWDVSADGLNVEVVLDGNRTLAINNASDGDYGTIRFIQDAVTGSRTIALPANSKVINGGAGAFTLSTGVDDEDIATWWFDGTDFNWNIGLNYT